jgi:hypothetical protein
VDGGDAAVQAALKGALRVEAGGGASRARWDDAAAGAADSLLKERLPLSSLESAAEEGVMSCDRLLHLMREPASKHQQVPMESKLPA